MPVKRKPDEDRFWSHVEKRGDDECWNWTAGVHKPRGYGMFSVYDGTRTGRKVGAHRYSFLLHKGEIPDGLCVCHRCDNVLCVNPRHLFLGTQADNQHDKVNKSRQARGSRQGHSKLKETDVATIKRLLLDGVQARKIARRFGVGDTAISLIKLGTNWRHVEPAAREQSCG